MKSFGGSGEGQGMPPWTSRLDDAIAFMNAGRWDEARSVLEPLHAQHDAPVVTNNLAVVYLDHDRDPARAYELLRPTIDSPDLGPQPFARALATRCLAALGDPDAARRLLDQAIRDLEAGLSGNRPWSSGPLEAWREYTVSVLRAAGSLEDDGLAWDAYQRFQGAHNNPEAHYLGGVAAFNRKRWSAASRAWSRVAGDGWGSIQAFMALLPLLDAGAVPAYRLPYCVPDASALLPDPERHPGEGLPRLARLAEQPTPDAEDLRWAEDTVRDVHDWTMLLALGVADAAQMPPEARATLVKAAVRFGGEPGTQLARTVMRAGALPTPLKMAAAQGLLMAGVIPSGSTVTVLVDGQESEIRVSLTRLVLGDEQLDARYREGLAARDQGRMDDARRILSQLADLEGETPYLPAVVAYANLLRGDGLYGRARTLLRLAAEAMPGDASILFNQAALCLQVGDFSGARRFLAAIGREEASAQGMDDQIAGLRRRIRLGETLAQQRRKSVDEAKERFEERTIPLDAGVDRSLDLLPVRWLDAACALYGLGAESPSRPERQRVLGEHLARDPAKAVALAVDRDPRGDLTALFRFLGGRGGWALKEDVVKRFGGDEADSVGPGGPFVHTTLGHARLTCMVFVGTARVDGAKRRIVGIPLELRAECARIAGLDASSSK